MNNNYPKDGQQGFQKGLPVVPVPPVMTSEVTSSVPAQEPVGDVSSETLAEYSRCKDILDSEVKAYSSSALRGSSGVLPDSFKRTNYSGYFLSERKVLLFELEARGVVPLHDRVVFEHITYQYPDKESAPECERVEIVGYAEADGVQAVLVALNGETIRPQGGFYHVTLSLAEGHKPAESNRMLENTLITMFQDPIDVTVARF